MSNQRENRKKITNPNRSGAKTFYTPYKSVKKLNFPLSYNYTESEINQSSC